MSRKELAADYDASEQDIADGQIASETVWNDLPIDGAGGGGISVEFAVPSYRRETQMPTNVDTGQLRRGVPDVAGGAGAETGYMILVDGNEQTIGGTSAVAPLWTGLVALINRSVGECVGFLQPQLYSAMAQAGFNRITHGNSGAYQAGAGWNPCTRLGSSSGAALLQALGGKCPLRRFRKRLPEPTPACDSTRPATLGSDTTTAGSEAVYGPSGWPLLPRAHGARNSGRLTPLSDRQRPYVREQLRAEGSSPGGALRAARSTEMRL